RTVLGSRLMGDWVNIEIDPQTQVIVETVERVLASRSM
ncbi:MAG TPA: riboflavin synthase, partial [Halomonas sp.]|nr:riboflavin synthase [Halomonas sp.]